MMPEEHYGPTERDASIHNECISNFTKFNARFDLHIESTNRKFICIKNIKKSAQAIHRIEKENVQSFQYIKHEQEKNYEDTVGNDATEPEEFCRKVISKTVFHLPLQPKKLKNIKCILYIQIWMRIMTFWSC